MRSIAWMRCSPGARAASSFHVAASQTRMDPSSHLDAIHDTDGCV